MRANRYRARRDPFNSWSSTFRNRCRIGTNKVQACGICTGRICQEGSRPGIQYRASPDMRSRGIIDAVGPALPVGSGATIGSRLARRTLRLLQFLPPAVIS